MGCSTLDQNGNIAAGTSTGGMTIKNGGELGTPIIGAGTYANNKTCGFSTSQDECFIRGVMRMICVMEYGGNH